jgi:hypothetical protein
MVRPRPRGPLELTPSSGRYHKLTRFAKSKVRGGLSRQCLLTYHVRGGGATQAPRPHTENSNAERTPPQRRSRNQRLISDRRFKESPRAAKKFTVVVEGASERTRSLAELECFFIGQDYTETRPGRSAVGLALPLNRDSTSSTGKYHSRRTQYPLASTLSDRKRKCPPDQVTSRRKQP